MAMEFDPWSSVPLARTGKATYMGTSKVEGEVRTVDVITVHAHQEAGSTLTISSPELRLK